MPDQAPDKTKASLAQAEEKLRECEAWRKALFDSLPANVALLDESGVILAVNDAWDRFAQENSDEPETLGVGANYLNVCREAGERFGGDGRRALEGIEEILSGKTDEFTMEYPCHTLHQRHWCLMRVTPLRGARGGAVIAHFLITARKEAEEALRKSEEGLRAILNAAVDAIITIDYKGVIVSVNPSTISMFGYTEEELVGSNVSILMPSPYREEHGQYLERFHETGEAKIIGVGRQLEARRKDGSVFPIDLAVSEVDHLGLFTGIIRDISERRALEMEVAQAVEEEKARIARELHDSQGALLTSVDMRLTGLRNKLERMSLAPEVREVDQISQQVRSAISQSRALSHGLHPAGTSPEELVEAIDRLVQRTRASGTLQCRFVRPSQAFRLERPNVGNELFRIAEEAIQNAIRHSEATHVTVTLAAKREGELSLSIVDNGKGFSPNDLQSEGLGLRIMEYRARSIGAALKISQRNEGGTRVCCVVPLSQE